MKTECSHLKSDAFKQGKSLLLGLFSKDINAQKAAESHLCHILDAALKKLDALNNPVLIHESLTSSKELLSALSVSKNLYDIISSSTENPDGCIYTIALRFLISQTRGKTKHAFIASLDSLDAPCSSEGEKTLLDKIEDKFTDDTENLQEREQIKQEKEDYFKNAVSNLPDLERLIIIQTMKGEKSGSIVNEAKKFDETISETKIYQRKHRAIATLKEQMSKYGQQ